MFCLSYPLPVWSRTTYRSLVGNSRYACREGERGAGGGRGEGGTVHRAVVWVNEHSVLRGTVPPREAGCFNNALCNN